MFFFFVLCLEKADLEVNPSFPHPGAANPQGCDSHSTKPPSSRRHFASSCSELSGLAELTGKGKARGFGKRGCWG